MTGRKLAILILLGVITVCWWYLAGKRDPLPGEPQPVAAINSPPPALLPPDAVPIPTDAGDIAPSVRTRALPNPDGTDPVIPSIPLETGKLGWEKSIDEITGAKIPDVEKGRRLLGTIPTMPVEGRETAAEKAVVLIPNSEYQMAQTAMSNPAMFGTAMGVLFSDLMNRPDELRLPTLLNIARNPEHPYAASARDNLNLILGKNLGTDWVGWDAAIRQHLAARR